MEAEDRLEEAERLAKRAYYAARDGSKTEDLAKAIDFLVAEIRELRDRITPPKPDLDVAIANRDADALARRGK